MEDDIDARRKSVSDIIGLFNSSNVGYSKPDQPNCSQAYKRRSVSSIAGLFSNISVSNTGNQPKFSTYSGNIKKKSRPPLSSVIESFENNKDRNNDSDANCMTFESTKFPNNGNNGMTLESIRDKKNGNKANCRTFETTKDQNNDFGVKLFLDGVQCQHITKDTNIKDKHITSDSNNSRKSYVSDVVSRFNTIIREDIMSDVSKPQSNSVPLSAGYKQPNSTSEYLSTGHKQLQSTSVPLSTGYKQPQRTSVSLSTGHKQLQSTSVSLSAGYKQPQSTSVPLQAGYKQPQSTSVPLSAGYKQRQSNSLPSSVPKIPYVPVPAPHTLSKCTAISPNKPTTNIPLPVNLKYLDPDIIKYILATRNKTETEKKISYVYGEIIWPKEVNTNAEVMIKCTLQKSMTIFEKKAETWEKDVERKFKEIFTHLTKKEITGLHDIWLECEDQFKKWRHGYHDEPQMTLKNETCSLLIVGKKEDMENFMTFINKKTSELREAKRKYIRHLLLRDFDTKYLLVSNFEKSLGNVEIKLDRDRNKISIIGTKDNIQSAQLKIQKLVGDLDHQKIQLSKPMCDLMKQDNIQRYLSSELANKKCLAVYDVTNENEISVYGESQAVHDAENVIRSYIKELTVNVTDEAGRLFTTSSWRTFVKQNLAQLQNEMMICLGSGRSMTVVATSRVYDRVLNGVNTFLKKYTATEKLLSYARGVVELIFQERKTVIDQIEQAFNVKIKVNSSIAQQGILIEGPEDDSVTSAVQIIEELCSKVVCTKHKINRDRFKCFLQENTKCILHSLQSHHKVVYTFDNSSIHDDIAVPRQATNNNIKTTIKLIGGEVINVVHGDLTNFSAQGVVSSANNQLQLTNGLSLAIAQKDQYGETSFSMAVYAVLQEAERLNCRSLAIPAISSGINGYPINKSCTIIVQAVQEFLVSRVSSSPVLKEINLVDISIERVNAFSDIVQQTFGKQEITEDEGFIDIYGFSITQANDFAKAITVLCGQETGSGWDSSALYKTEIQNRASTDVSGFFLTSKVPAGQTFALTTLQRGTSEYVNISSSFTSGLKDRSMQYTVLKIERLENPSLYAKYHVNKEIAERNNKSHVIERKLWHGTSERSVVDINSEGFNRSYCGKNGTAYGKGVYFATSPTLASQYARPISKRRKFMYYCSVLTGSYTKGNPSYKVPPAKNPWNPSLKYNSVVDNVSNPTMFVVFQDAQAYPEYLITFQ